MKNRTFLPKLFIVAGLLVLGLLLFLVFFKAEYCTVNVSYHGGYSSPNRYFVPLKNIAVYPQDDSALTLAIADRIAVELNSSGLYGKAVVYPQSNQPRVAEKEHADAYLVITKLSARHASFPFKRYDAEYLLHLGTQPYSSDMIPMLFHMMFDDLCPFFGVGMTKRAHIRLEASARSIVSDLDDRVIAGKIWDEVKNQYLPDLNEMLSPASTTKIADVSPFIPEYAKLPEIKLGENLPVQTVWRRADFAQSFQECWYGWGKDKPEDFWNEVLSVLQKENSGWHASKGNPYVNRRAFRLKDKPEIFLTAECRKIDNPKISGLSPFYEYFITYGRLDWKKGDLAGILDKLGDDFLFEQAEPFSGYLSRHPETVKRLLARADLLDKCGVHQLLAFAIMAAGKKIQQNQRAIELLKAAFLRLPAPYSDLKLEYDILRTARKAGMKLEECKAAFPGYDRQSLLMAGMVEIREMNKAYRIDMKEGETRHLFFMEGQSQPHIYQAHASRARPVSPALSVSASAGSSTAFSSSTPGKPMWEYAATFDTHGYSGGLAGGGSAQAPEGDKGGIVSMNEVYIGYDDGKCYMEVSITSPALKDTFKINKYRRENP